MIYLLALLALLLASPAEASTRRVQGCSATAAFPATTVSCNMTSPVLSGSALLIGSAAGSSVRTMTSFTATSDTCTIDTPLNNGSPTAGVIYVGSCLNITANTPTVSANWDSGATLFIIAEEYTGITALSAFDATGAGSAAVSPCTATSSATTFATEVVFGFCQLRVSSAPTAGSSCTIQTDFVPGTGDRYISISKNVTTTGAQTCSLTMTDTNWNMIVATYKSDSGHLFTQASDCIDTEASDRLISEDGSTTAGSCGTTTPERSKMGVGI